MNESDRDEVAYKIANWDLTLGVANRAHRDATGNIYDKFRYNNVTGYIYMYDNEAGIYKYIYSDTCNRGLFVDRWV